MRESQRAWMVVGVMVAAAVVIYIFWVKPFLSRQPLVLGVMNANSTWAITMQSYFPEGPVAEETYRLSNDNGKTTMFFAATNRAGTVTKQFTVPLVGPEGTFLFEELRANGLWELDDRPVRLHPHDEYIIEVEQTLGDEGGSHAFTFSDPAFWATTNAQEFNFKVPLGRASPGATDRTTMNVGSQKLREPRYLQIVLAIRSFGPSSVLDAEAKIRAELADTLKHPIAAR